MTVKNATPAARKQVVSSPFQGNDRLLLGIVLSVVTFWLFAQTTLNISPTMGRDLGIEQNWINIAVSITALFSGIFIVVMGGLGDRIGRVKLSMIGIGLGIIGSLLIAISPTGTVALLMAGRIIQGISAACIMPNTLGLVKAYWEGAERQRAVSFWSIGSWGGSGAAALFGGIVAVTIGWRYIFWASILVSIVAFLLMRGTPESKVYQKGNEGAFDWSGLIAFMVALICINIVIGQGAQIGWANPIILVLTAIFLVAAIAFFRIENSKDNSFVDLSLFKNKTYAGATLSNFLLNGSAGTLLVALSLVQEGASMSALQAGLLTLGYLIAILATIRVGEKLLRMWGPRKPMWLGCVITGAGILLTIPTWIFASQYVLLAIIGFTLYGIGLGFYATPSTDAALSSVPKEKAASAAGIYKMASSLGAAFGVAISAAIYTGLSSEVVALANSFMVGRIDNLSVRFAALIALLFNLIMVIIAIISIVMTVPPGLQEEAA
jgi:DHA2 family multidrug resistance protein-like MFS transporter